MSAPSEVKQLIAPFQQILLKKGKCVACLRDLKSEEKKALDNDTEEVFCKCRRIYIHKIQEDIYRRALIEEI